MDKQAVLMFALATLFVAAIVVGVCGSMLFSRTKPPRTAALDSAGSHPEADAS